MCRTSIRALCSILLGLILTCILVARPDAAFALSVTPDPLEADLNPLLPIVATIDFLGMTVGAPAGSTTLAGSVGASDVSLIFTIEVDPSTPTGSSATFENLNLFTSGSAVVSALGTLPGPGVDAIDANLSFERVSFDPTGLEPGEISDPFFISYAADPTGTEISFELLDGAAILGQVQVVPEPATAMLLASGLVLVAVRRRRAVRPA